MTCFHGSNPTLEELCERAWAPGGVYVKTSYGYLHVSHAVNVTIFSVAPAEGPRTFKQVARIDMGAPVPNVSAEDVPLVDLSRCERCEAKEVCCPAHEARKVDAAVAQSVAQSVAGGTL